MGRAAISSFAGFYDGDALHFRVNSSGHGYRARYYPEAFRVPALPLPIPRMRAATANADICFSSVCLRLRPRMEQEARN